MWPSEFLRLLHTNFWHSHKRLPVKKQGTALCRVLHLQDMDGWIVQTMLLILLYPRLLAFPLLAPLVTVHKNVGLHHSTLAIGHILDYKECETAKLFAKRGLSGRMNFSKQVHLRKRQDVQGHRHKKKRNKSQGARPLPPSSLQFPGYYSLI